MRLNVQLMLVMHDISQRCLLIHLTAVSRFLPSNTHASYLEYRYHVNGSWVLLNFTTEAPSVKRSGIISLSLILAIILS